jgi:hypothetical protein
MSFDEQVNITFKVQYDKSHEYTGLIADVTHHVSSDIATIIISDNTDFKEHILHMSSEEFKLSGYIKVQPLNNDQFGIWLDFHYGQQEWNHVEGIFVLFPKYESIIPSNNEY